MKLKLGHKGQVSLVEILVAAGLVGGLGLVLGQLGQQGSKVIKTSDVRQGIQQATMLAMDSFRDKASCDNTLKNRTLNSNESAPVDFTAGQALKTSTGRDLPIAHLGVVDPSSKTVVQIQYRLLEDLNNTDVGNFNGEIILSYDIKSIGGGKNSRVFGAQGDKAIINRIPFIARVDATSPAARKILECAPVPVLSAADIQKIIDGAGGGGGAPVPAPADFCSQLGGTLEAGLCRNIDGTVGGTGRQNVGLGAGALEIGPTGNDNTGIGVFALEKLSSGARNTAVGNSAARATTLGSENLAMGFKALEANTTGLQNTAGGAFALQKLGSGTGNTALGHSAASSLASSGADEGILAIGYEALKLAQKANNTAVGYKALGNLSTGEFNTALGNQAGNRSNGSENVFLGHLAGRGKVGGQGNVAIGFATFAGDAGISGGDFNLAIGRGSLTSTNAASADNNIAIGEAALNGLNSGANNIALGKGAGAENRTGSNNIFIGSGACLDNASNTFIVKHNANANPGSCDPTGPLMHGTFDPATGRGLGLGILGAPQPGFALSVNGDMRVVGEIDKTSDRRLKDNIQDLKGILPLVLRMKPVSYHYKARVEKRLSYGFIAQDILEIFPSTVHATPDGYLSLSYSDFIPLAVQALQEHHREVASNLDKYELMNQGLESKITLLEGQLKELSEDYERLLKANLALQDRLEKLESIH